MSVVPFGMGQMWVGVWAQCSSIATTSSVPVLRGLVCCALVPSEGSLEKFRRTEVGSVILLMKLLVEVVRENSFLVGKRESMHLVMTDSTRAMMRW
jgi:hypothetical protein